MQIYIFVFFFSTEISKNARQQDKNKRANSLSNRRPPRKFSHREHLFNTPFADTNLMFFLKDKLEASDSKLAEKT